MPRLWQELRLAVRTMRRARLVTGAAILTLAIGTGGVAAVYSVIDAAILRALPYAEADRLVVLDGTYTPSPPGVPKRALDITDWRAMRGTFQRLAVVFAGGVNLTGAGAARRIAAAQVSAKLTQLLGIRPILGRAFTPEDGTPGHDQVALVSDVVWREQFGGARDIVGRTLQLNGRPFTVIGVLPTAAGFPAQTDVWIPYAEPHDWHTDLFHGPMAVVARLADGVSLEQARSAAARAEAAFAATIPSERAPDPIQLLSLRTVLMGDTRTTLTILAGAAALLLILACANVGGLLLARAETRQHEVAVRLAIGASTTDLARQLLIEGMVLAAAGMVGGLVLAWALRPLLTALLPVGLVGIAPVRVDARVLGITLLVACTSVGLFCFAPAVALRRADVHALLKAGGPRTAAATGRLWHRLLVAQIGLTVVILVGAGLLLKSVWLLQRADTGFDRQHVLTVRVALPPTAYATRAQVAAYDQSVLASLRQIPGVESVGLVNSLPLTGGTSNFAYTVVGEPPVADRSHRPMAEHLVASPGYFTALRIPVLAGRTFTDADLASGASVAVIDAQMARHIRSVRDAVGMQIRMPWDSTYRVIGVVQSVRDRSLDGSKAPPGQFYFPMTLDPPAVMTLVVRTRRIDSRVIQMVREAIRAVDPSIPPYDLRTMQQVVTGSIVPMRTITLLLTIGAGVGVVLAVVGIFGVVAATVTRRTRELGVRLALGATQAHVARLVLRHALAVAGWGLGVGVLAAWGATRVLEHVLYHVAVTDPVVLTVVAGCVAFAAVLAAIVPAWRASAIDPMTSLRAE